MVKKKNIAIIPARGGSKRIPKKNIKDFFGKPMIAWTIEAALKSKLFDRIIVSTEDEEVAVISRKCGAEVPFYRDKYTDDYSAISVVTSHALEQAEKHFQESYEIVVQLMANCPLRDVTDICNAYENIINKKNTYQVSSFKFGWMNPWWAYKVDDLDNPTPLFEYEVTQRSQDLPDLQCPTGAIWIAKVDEFKKTKDFYSTGYKFCEINWKSAVDIDNFEDLEMAKLLFLMKNKEEI